MDQFDSKVAIVTGAGEGIGLAIARGLAMRGAAVVLNDVDEVKATNAAAQIVADGGIALGLGGDVADVESVRGMVDRTVANFGRIDITVANAGITLWNNFLDYEAADFQRVLNVNLGGAFFLAQATARQMKKQGDGGRILFMSSVTGQQAIEYLSAYAMTKAALSMLARQLVVELGPLGITTNAIAPGATITPRNLQDDPAYDASWSAITPTGHVASTDDIAHAAFFLLSPAAAQINGQTLTVDGGWAGTSPVPKLDFVKK